jgi:hypothetical protein
MKTIITFAFLMFTTIASAQTTAPATQPLRSSNGFVIGVFSQPVSTMPMWTSQGVNTFVQWEPSSSPEQWWAGTATEAGANTIRIPVTQPSSNPTVTGAQWEAWDASYAPPAGGMAWALPDEPDGNGIAPAALTAQAATFRANARKLPVWLNVRGGSINGLQPAPSPIAQYLACADWIAEDFYPIAGWGDATKLLANGLILDQLTALAPGKPKMCFIECSNQQLSWISNPQCVTPAQFRAEVWDAVIHGAYGICYFPQQIGNGFQFDARPANIVAEMQADNVMLKGLQWESGSQVTSPAPFECCLRTYQGKPAYIVLNTSSTSAPLQGASLAAYSVTFSATNPFPTSPASAPTSAPIVDPLAVQVAALQAQVKALTAQNATLTATIATYSQRIVALNSEIAALNAQLAAKPKSR